MYYTIKDSLKIFNIVYLILILVIIITSVIYYMQSGINLFFALCGISLGNLVPIYFINTIVYYTSKDGFGLSTRTFTILFFSMFLLRAFYLLYLISKYKVI
jgi:uncharacterized protein with PQ loop repeat